MARFSRPERQRIDEFLRELSILRLGGPPIIESCLPLLSELLGLDQALIYSVRQEDEITLDQVASAGRRASLAVVAREAREMVHIKGVRRHMGVFNPARPQRQQRNRPVAFSPSAQLLASFREPRALDRFGVPREDAEAAIAGMRRQQSNFEKMGVAEDWQVRVLICEGESLLAWVGGFREEQPRERELRLLRAVTPALRCRLATERLLEQAPALAAALEGIGSSAFLVSRAGAVLQANSAGRAWLDHHPAQLRRALAEAVARGATPGPFQRTRIVVGASTPMFLLIAKAGDRVAALVARAAQRWELTRRQHAVLSLVARGQANKTIAAALDCAESTVEFHMTALLAKSGTESRAELVARVLIDE